MVPDILYKLFQSSKQQQENEYYYPYFLFYLKGTKFYKNEGSVPCCTLNLVGEKWRVMYIQFEERTK